MTNIHVKRNRIEREQEQTTDKRINIDCQSGRVCVYAATHSD